MTYEEQNHEIRKRLNEIASTIEDLQESYRIIENRLDYEDYRLAISSKLSSLKAEMNYLNEKLKESPEKRIKTNRREKIVGSIEKIAKKLPDAPEIEHVSGRLYRVNDGCFWWWLILAAIFLFIMWITGSL